MTFSAGHRPIKYKNVLLGNLKDQRQPVLGAVKKICYFGFIVNGSACSWLQR
jgi:hypothetical protein